MFPIFPSLLAFDLLKLEEQTATLSALDIAGFHLDVMDGQFVPNITFGASLCNAVKRVTDKPINAHLMTYTPHNLFSDLQKAGVTKVYIHPESTPHINRVLHQALDNGLTPAIAINPGTPLCVIEPLIDIIEGVLIMTVNPGFGGQSILDNSIDRIKKCSDMLRAYPNVELIADGGIKLNNIKTLKDAGLTAAVIGTAIFKGVSIDETVQDFVSI